MLKHCLYFVVLAMVAHTSVADVSIESVEAVLVEDAYQLVTDISYDLPDEVQEALQNGITLQFSVNAKVIRFRDWMWNETVSSGSRRYSIRYRPLAKHYQVTQLETKQESFHKTLSSALRALGKIRDWPVVTSAELVHKELYQIQVDCQLDISALPLPLQPTAYFSSAWHLQATPAEWRLIY